MYHGNKIIISTEEKYGQPRRFKEEKTAYADHNLFSFFSIPLLYGQPGKVLKEANNVVLSQSTAIRYFGDIDPTGELLKLNDTITLKVSGVYQDLPHYSHLDFDLVFSNAGLQNKWSTAMGFGTVSYVKLQIPSFHDFESKLNQRTSHYYAETLRSFPMAKVDLFVQPLPEIPFSRNFAGDNFYPKSKPFLLTLAFIGLSVLTMAWVNFINLTVTRTTRRFKEVATRKVSGAKASDIVRQFVMESLVTNVLAIALAVTLVQMIRNPVSFLFNIQIAQFSTLSLGSAAIFGFIIISGILLSGFYPAFIAMAYQPRALFNMSTMSLGKRFIPSFLTVSQLAVAIIFILLGFTVSLQLNHILNMDTGIKKEEIVIFDAPIVKPGNYPAILSSLKKQISEHVAPGAICLSSSLFNGFYYAENIHLKRVGADLFFGMDGNTVDEDYIPVYGIRILAGRNFIKDDQPSNIIISRFAATRLGFDSPEEAVGSPIEATTLAGSWKHAVVIGVFEDFRVAPFLDLSQSSSEYSDKGRGIVLAFEGHSFGLASPVHERISVRIQPQNFDETIRTIQDLFEQQFPGYPVNWYFLDDYINQVYVSEKASRNQIILFTSLAVFIACLGLLGMLSNKVVEKTKEIGIRKVLGAELHQIAQILLSTTVKQVILATVLGIPLAWYLTQQYLEKFSERITLQWWHFALPVLILVVIMFVTIASVLWKAARSNPVEALKYE